MRKRNVAIGNLDGRMRLSPNLANSLKDFCHPTTVSRMVTAQAAAICVEGQLADARDQISVRDKPAALALFAKAQILQRFENGDGE